METFVPHPDFPSVNLAAKGQIGPVRIGYFSHASEGSKFFIKSATNVGISYNTDFNTSEGTLGVNKVGASAVLSPIILTRQGRPVRMQNKRIQTATNHSQVTYIDKGGKRVSSESAYLTKDVLARPNLKVVVHATVTRVITERVGGEIKALGVEFAQAQGSPRFRVRAKRDVVVSYVAQR